MAGHMISLYFKESGHDVTVFSRKSINYCKNIIGDATEFYKLKNIILNGKYDAVINAIGILNQSAESNKSMSVLLNSYLPHYLSQITSKTYTKIIHMSTDCVFSGKTGCYTENSFRDGVSFYDRTKGLGEIDNKKDLTFRNSFVGPDLNESGIGLFNWFMKQEDKIVGYSKAIWTGVSTITLAKAMEQALREKLVGLYNLVNNTTISKLELLKLFNIYFKNGEIEIIASEKISLDKSLVCSRKDFSFIVPEYKTMILEMKDWISEHKELYPHYDI